MAEAGETKGSFKCPRCGASTWGDLNFCQECGQDLFFECPGCEATWRFMFEYLYCPSCGAKTGQSSEKREFG